jgi:hypothetical protein
MRALLRPLLGPLLRRFLMRDPAEIAVRARPFHIATSEGRALVGTLGEAFLLGYNTMLTAPSTAEVAARGRDVEAHFRPFYFEGAAMGYLPRGYLSTGYTPANAERDLLAMDPAYRYLYYVGLGFWFGMRHPRRPESLRALEAVIDPLYYPLCYDGYGFKMAFFDHARDPRAIARLERCPAEHRPAIYQGFGRALFFVHMDDEPGYRRLAAGVPAERRADIELGRSLATGFTGLDRPLRILQHLRSSADETELGARLTGVTWALTARAMNDPAHYQTCLDRVDDRSAAFLRTLPPLCTEALHASASYFEWQRRTRDAALRAHAEHRESLASEPSSRSAEH